MFNNRKIRQISKFEQYFMISMGIILMVAGFYYFLIPVDLVAGGVTGIGLIMNHIFGISISIVVLIFNIGLLLLGLVMLGKKIFFRSIYGSVLFPAVLFIFERFVPVLDFGKDFLLASVFGGVMLGVGFGMVLKYGGTSGGTDIPVKILNKRFKLPISLSVYLIDGVIVFGGTLAFYANNGLAGGLYALIAIFISGKVADIVVVGNNSKKAVQIITDHPDEIKEAIYASIIRGVSKIDIYGGYTNNKKAMLITVITKREYYTVRNIIASIDENAFVYVTPATEIHGDFYERESE